MRSIMSEQEEVSMAELYSFGYKYGFELAKFHYESLGYFPPDEFKADDAISAGYRSYVAAVRRRIG